MMANTKKKDKRGGAREGAGRKPRETPAECYTIKADKEDVDIIRKRKLHGEVRDFIAKIARRERYRDLEPPVQEPSSQKPSSRFLKEWMMLDQDNVDQLREEDWKHYENGGCLCSAHGPYECICGSWHVDHHK